MNYILRGVSDLISLVNLEEERRPVCCLFGGDDYGGVDVWNSVLKSARQKVNQ